MLDMSDRLGVQRWSRPLSTIAGGISCWPVLAARRRGRARPRYHQFRRAMSASYCSQRSAVFPGVEARDFVRCVSLPLPRGPTSITTNGRAGAATRTPANQSKSIDGSQSVLNTLPVGGPRRIVAANGPNGHRLFRHTKYRHFLCLNLDALLLPSRSTHRFDLDRVLPGVQLKPL